MITILATTPIITKPCKLFAVAATTNGRTAVGDKTNIQWCGSTWNPMLGCRRTSPGCVNCYAEKLSASRLRHLPTYGQVTDGKHWNGERCLVADKLDQPVRWKRPRTIFVCSMSDVFYEGHPDEDIASVFAIMLRAQQHTFQVLTKRSTRMAALLSSPRFVALVQEKAGGALHGYRLPDGGWCMDAVPWPLPNVWCGVSAEDAANYSTRVPHLKRTPAVLKFVSAEPLLGEIRPMLLTASVRECVDWMIIGGESGPGARPLALHWVRELIAQSRDIGALPFVKQLGACWADDVGAASRKGGDMAEWPADLRVREIPSTRNQESSS